MMPREGEPPSSTLVLLLLKAFELSSDGITLVTADHTLVRANGSWLEMHGFERGDEAAVIGRTLHSFCSPAEIGGDLAPFLDRLAKVGSAEGALGQLRCDGDPFQTWTTASRLEGGDPASYVFLSRDLSEERAAATALRRTTGFLDSIVDNIPDMVFVKRAEDLRFVLMNRAGEELLGYAQGELLGKSDRDFFPPEQATFFIEKDRAVLQGKSVMDISEEPIQTKRKGTRWLHTKKIPVFDVRGVPQYLLGIAEDITERRAFAEAQASLLVAQEAVKIRDEFISIASHQLNNPLGAAMLHADALVRQAAEAAQRGAVLPPRMAGSIDSLHRVIVRMAMLVATLLDVSKIEAGRLELRREDVDLAELVRETVALLAPQLTRCGSELKIVADGPVMGSWDRLRLGEVVANLVSNAIKYGHNAPIDIAVARHREGWARLTVHDRGIGIAAEDQENIWKRFQRAGTARSVPGLGLGLWIARQFVLAHDGKITVESSPGEGSTFVVDLPLQPSAAARAS